MKFLFIPYELSVLALKKRFNEPCIARYGSKTSVEKDNPHGFQMNKLGSWYKHNSGEIEKHFISAPLYIQIVDWFRNEHKLVLDVFQQFDEVELKYTGKWEVDISRLGQYEQPHVIVVNEVYDDYYEAWNRGIKEILNYIS